MSSDHSSYVSAVVARLWDYAGREFGDQPELLESAEPSPTRPPVFAAGAAEHNLLYPSDALAEVRRAIVDAIPRAERHRHFASMRSSQALAQSVFGSLVALGKVGMLAGLTTDDGLPAFFDDVARSHVQMEYAVGHLGRTEAYPVGRVVQGGASGRGRVQVHRAGVQSVLPTHHAAGP